jgi:hypothetical protein
MVATMGEMIKVGMADLNICIAPDASYKATPTQDPSPSVVNASGAIHIFKSAIPTFIISPIVATIPFQQSYFADLYQLIPNARMIES